MTDDVEPTPTPTPRPRSTPGHEKPRPPADWDRSVPWPPPTPGDAFGRGGRKNVPRVVALGVCGDCGFIHSRCSGHLTKTNREVPCKRTAAAGLTVCRTHGANAAQVAAAGARTLTRERALGEVGELMAEALDIAGELPGIDQLAASIDVAYAKAWCYRTLLDALPQRSQWSFEEHETHEGSRQRFVVVDTEGMLGPDQHGNQQLHAYEEGHRHWIRLHAQLVKTAHDIGMDERRQAFDEQRARIVVAMITHVVTGLGRELDDPAVVPVVNGAIAMLDG